MMALPFLPGVYIAPAFKDIKRSVAERADERLTELAEYYENTWLQNALWTPSAWSVYRETVRTNNDVEGWHARSVLIYTVSQKIVHALLAITLTNMNRFP